jgi:hypothetical protein
VDEPPAPEARARLLIALGTAEALGLTAADAAAHLAEAYDVATTDDERLQAAVLLAQIASQHAAVEDGVRLLERLLEDVGEHDPLAPVIEAQIANHARFQAGAHRRAAPARRRLADRLRRGEALGGSALSSVAADLTMAGESAAQAHELVVRALDGPVADPHVPHHTVIIAVRVLLAVDDLERAGRLLDAMIDTARCRGTVLDFAYACAFRADLGNRRGDVFAAEADARTTLEVALEHGWPLGRQAAVAHLITALIERGRLGEAGDLLSSAGFDGPPRSLPDVYTSALLLHARGGLRTASGAPADGLADQLEAGERLAAHDETNPALVPWRSGRRARRRRARRHEPRAGAGGRRGRRGPAVRRRPGAGRSPSRTGRGDRGRGRLSRSSRRRRPSSPAPRPAWSSGVRSPTWGGAVGRRPP